MCLNSEGPKHSEVGGCLQNPKWAFGGKLTDENAWRASAVGGDNINERLMKINVRRN
ncbi:MAG: hypothetical protein ACTS6P_01180 [Candidatus Hodgkinia cicadicola]